MDATDLIVGDVMSHQNEAPNSGVDGVTTEKLNTGDDTVIINEGPNESAKTVELEAKSVIVDSLAEKDGEESTLQEEFISLALQKVQQFLMAYSVNFFPLFFIHLSTVCIL